MIPLTDRQHAVLDFIRAGIAAKGYPPTLREIGAHFGIKSTNGVRDHVNCLERKGYIVRSDMKSRGIRVTGAAPLPLPVEEEDSEPHAELIQVPVLARIRAGRPLISEGEILTTYTLPAEEIPGEGMLFALRVQGHAMAGEGIVPGDDIIFRARTSAPPSGALCAVLLGEEAIVRRVFHGGSFVRFVSANPTMPTTTMHAADFSGAMVLGVAVRLWRSITPGAPPS